MSRRTGWEIPVIPRELPQLPDGGVYVIIPSDLSPAAQYMIGYYSDPYGRRDPGGFGLITQEQCDKLKKVKIAMFEETERAEAEWTKKQLELKGGAPKKDVPKTVGREVGVSEGGVSKEGESNSETLKDGAEKGEISEKID